MRKGEKVLIRPVKRKDAQLMLLWENDPRNWRVTETEEPYTLSYILAFIDSLEDVQEACQLRMIIEENATGERIGTVDLNNINFKNLNATIGILIADEKHRGKGYAKEALSLLMDYAKEELHLHSLSASIMNDNEASIRLFESEGFKLVGSRKEWFKVEEGWRDEKIYQQWLKERKKEE